MRINSLKAIFKTAVLGAAVLLLGAGVAGAQQQINLTAAPTAATMPEAGLPQPPGWPDQTNVSLNPAVLTAAFTVVFCTGSISLSSMGTSAS